MSQSAILMKYDKEPDYNKAILLKMVEYYRIKKMLLLNLEKGLYGFAVIGVYLSLLIFLSHKYSILYKQNFVTNCFYKSTIMRNEYSGKTPLFLEIYDKF